MTDGQPISGRTRKPDCDAEVRRLLIKAMKSGPRSKSLSREQIADLLSRALGENVTAYMLYGFTSKKKKKVRFPASFVAALIECTGDDELAKFVVGPRLRKYCELGEAVAELLPSLRKNSRRPAW